jgi:hypothetical protein
LIAPAWGPHVEGVLRGRVGDRIASSFDAYAMHWQEARVEACTATHVRRDQSNEALDRRVACLDRARGALHATVSTLLGSVEEIARPDAVAESLPPTERCDVARAPAPARESAAAIAAIEAELTRLEVYFAGGAPSISLADTLALRERADKLGYTPTTLRARMLEARIAVWAGERVIAEGILRDVIVQAERANDDAARALASAYLASLIAKEDVEEAAQLVAGGRAVLARAGGDGRIDEALVSAEVDVLESRGELREAAALQERLVKRIEKRAPGARVLVGAVNRLAHLWGLVPDYTKMLDANSWSLRISRAIDAIEDPQQLFREMPLDLAARGDFDGAIALGLRQLTFLRSLPEPPRRLMAYILNVSTDVHLMNLDYDECVRVGRENVIAWSQPLNAYALPDEPVNAAEIEVRRVEAVFSIGSCLLTDGKALEALVELRRARELAVELGKSTASIIPRLDRNIGIALVETGDVRGGRALLEPLVPSIANEAPLTRARVRFALARAIWLDAGTDERPRARALAEDAIRDLDEALATKELSTGPMRKLPVALRQLRATIETWLAAHRL